MCNQAFYAAMRYKSQGFYRGSVMSMSNMETTRFVTLHPVLNALTPGHVSSNQIEEQFRDLARNQYRLDNRCLAEADRYTSEILHNVDNVLAKYQGDFLSTYLHQRKKVEKDLLWAGLQLFARLQAIEQEVGFILEPHTEYADILAKFKTCRDLLTRIGSEQPINELYTHRPVLSDESNHKWYEKSFKDFIKYIDARNDTRLFWVWGRPNLDLALEYANQSEARAHLAETTYIPGQISWSLYLFRGTLFFLKYMNKRFHDPKWLRQMEGLSLEEQAIYRAQYLQAYWDVYKYRILNDYVWGPINLVCFKWWTGWWGDFSTCFLLCMDIYLTHLGNAEELEKFQHIQDQYDERLIHLNKEIIGLMHNGVKKQLSKKENGFDLLRNEDKIMLLESYLAEQTVLGEKLSIAESALAESVADWSDVYQAQQDHAKRWERKKVFLKYDKIYTKLLLVAFAMCVCFLVTSFLPVTLSVFLTKSGTMACLALTIWYRAARVFIQIGQDREEKNALLVQEKQCIQNFWNLKIQFQKAPTQLIAEKMQHGYLSILKIGEQINQKSASIQYQYFELARTSLMRILIPTAIGLTLIYAPTTLFMVPTYVFTLAASAALAYALDCWAKTYKPSEEIAAPSLHQRSYNSFVDRPRLYSHHTESSIFYRPPPRTTTDLSEEPDMVESRTLFGGCW